MAYREEYREPLIPDWAPKAYLWVAAGAALIYLLLSQANPGAGLLPLVKVTPILMLAFYAAFSRAPLLALALLLSAGGDFALDLRPPDWFWGITLFGLAHLVYIAIFGRFILRDGVRRDGIVLAVALVAFGGAMAWWLAPVTGTVMLTDTLSFTPGVMGYIAVITVMAIAAAFVKGPRLILAGALLFLVSDTILAARLFRELHLVAGLDWGAFGIWVTYFAAQLCLALGVVRNRKKLEPLPEELA
jgi:uncharacterized membrane protein YhhN